MAIFVSMYGLVVNLAFPKLVWEKEISVIKQSASSLISILTLMAFAFTICVLCAEEKVLSENGKIDPLKLNALIFDQFQSGYYVATEKVGQAWNAGKDLMK